jgi:LAO/AO transport system kinase
VDKLAKVYRDRGLSVGVIAVDPSSPFTGGAVLGDRIRMAATVGDMEVFFRSMSARGQLGGLSTATADAVKALDAFGKDRILVETVGAGQNEVDIVRTADTVVVLVQPGSGDDVQMLKAGILEIGDVFVVNKADMAGADRTVSELEEMIHFRRDPAASAPSGHHGPAERAGSGTRDAPSGPVSSDRSPDADAADATDTASGTDDAEADQTADDWVPSVVETVATTGDGIDDLVETLESHRTYLRQSGRLAEKARNRYASEIRQLLRNDVGELVEAELERQGGIDSLATAVHDRETDPYTLADEVLDPVRECVQDERTRRDDGDDG